MGNSPDGIYVDLGCFMNNIQVLQNHSDNMMIDLSLLLSNIKSCSYVKKNKDKKKNINKITNAEQIVEQITSKIHIPQPDVVKLKNLQANVLVSGSNTNNSNQVLGIVQEPFESTDSLDQTDSLNPKPTQTSYDWSNYDFIKVVILVIILALLIFRK